MKKLIPLYAILLVLISGHLAFAQSSSVTIPTTSSPTLDPSSNNTSAGTTPNTAGPFSASSSEGSSSTNLGTVFKNKKIEDPNVITDQKLKADEGSRSRYSMKANVQYVGPGIGDLSNPDQPNPDHVVNTMQTKLIGTYGVRYRLDGVNALNAGTGINFIHPFHTWDRTDIASPFLSYDNSMRVYDVQIRQTVTGGIPTTPEYTNSGEVATAAYAVNLVKRVADTRLAVGLDTTLNYFFYGRYYTKSYPADYLAAQDYLSFYPNLKYNFTDSLNVNTATAVMFYNLRADPVTSDINRRTVTQQLGVGYSFAKDVYFNPFITFYPTNVRTDNTTFNLSAVFALL